MTLTVLIIVSLIWFVIGVIAANTAKYVAAVATSTIKTVAAVATSQVKTAIAVAIATSTTYMQRVAAVATSIIDGLVMAVASDMPDTSTYALNVAADSTEYAAGEYLLRDNGTWRNVYLTAHARALIGDSADVIALSPATVIDASGSSKVWTVSFA